MQHVTPPVLIEHGFRDEYKAKHHSNKYKVCQCVRLRTLKWNDSHDWSTLYSKSTNGFQFAAPLGIPIRTDTSVAPSEARKGNIIYPVCLDISLNIKYASADAATNQPPFYVRIYLLHSIRGIQMELGIPFILASNFSQLDSCWERFEKMFTVIHDDGRRVTVYGRW